MLPLHSLPAKNRLCWSTALYLNTRPSSANFYCIPFEYKIILGYRYPHRYALEHPKARTFPSRPATMDDVESLAREVVGLLQELVTSASGNADQVARFQHVQELVFNRDQSGSAHRLLHAAMPFVSPLVQNANAALGAAVLSFVAQAVRRSSVFLVDAFAVVDALLVLSFASERNVVQALQLAGSWLPEAFRLVCASQADPASITTVAAPLWAGVNRTLERSTELLSAGPILDATSNNNNRSTVVWLRAWKYLEAAVLLHVSPMDAAMYRDPARSNVQPDENTVDRVPAGHPVLDKAQLEHFGLFLLQALCDVGPTPSSSSRRDLWGRLTRREFCMMINSLSLIAALRPQLMSRLLPCLVAFNSEPFPGSVDPSVQATLTSNFIKLLSHPAAQPFAEEVTECLISLGASERAFRAISKSKESRRKYVSAPSEASLRKATRIGKRSVQSITETVENDNFKRMRNNASAPAATPAPTSASTQVTHEGIVNIPSSEVVNLVLESFTSELPTPPPPNLKLELPPSELKARMTTLLAKIATPSSTLAIENSIKRMRDPRRRRDPRTQQHEQPALVQIFDESTTDEVSDWISKNASSIAEPLISVSEDNEVQVYLKPVTHVWCREMAVDALSRILENEYGVRIRGDEALREQLLCRLASSPWLLMTDERNQRIEPTANDAKIPYVYQTILDFVLEDFAGRASLATALLHHEYVRVTQSQLSARASTDEAATTSDSDLIYRKASSYFFSSFVKKMDLSSAADKKLFGTVVAQSPRISVEILKVVTSLFRERNGVVLGITLLRDLIKERKMCQAPALKILLRFTCNEEESCRNSAIRCVANQLYSIDALKQTVEEFAVRLVASLRTQTTDENMNGGAVPAVETEDDPMTGNSNGTGQVTADTHENSSQALNALPTWLQAQLNGLRRAEAQAEGELASYAKEIEKESDLSKPVDTDPETLRRLELLLALCAKKPSLLIHLVSTYGYASEAVRLVIFHAIEKLIKHLKQRGSGMVVSHVHGFEPNALGLVCHVIQILSTRARPNEEVADIEDLVQHVLTLYSAHKHVPDAISVLIPVLPSIRAEILFPLLPELLMLPQARLSVAITRLLEAMPPQTIPPIDLLVALHHVDLKSEPSMQKKVIKAINFCVEHRHAFPSDVLLHVCRVLVQDEKISKLALRTLILSVTTYPALQQDMSPLLEILISRKVWEMEDALWKGFVKCSALIQPASFPVLLHQLPVAQLKALLDEEHDLRPLMRQFVSAHERFNISEEVRDLLFNEPQASTEETPVIEDLPTTQTPAETTSVEAIPSEAPVETNPSEAPVEDIPAEAPVETTPGGVSVEAIPAEVLVEGIPAEAPIEAISTEVPVEAIPNDAPIEGIPAEAPVEAVFADTPVEVIPAKTSVEVIPAEAILADASPAEESTETVPAEAPVEAVPAET